MRRAQLCKHARVKHIISINALAWSATFNSVALSVGMPISINALAWSATVTQCRTVSWTQVFQSTHSHGVRQPPHSFFNTVFHFNQRTRMECDFIGSKSSSCVPYFNQRTRMECDIRRRSHWRKYEYFNQRTRMECDAFKCKRSSWRKNFNQRTRMECDKHKALKRIMSYIFQSTHSHGVRPALFGRTSNNKEISINALAWSATF